MTDSQTSLDPGICEQLREVLDPEVGLNIVDLGLVREAQRSPEAIEVKMTLTSRACPMGAQVVGEVRDRLGLAYPDAKRIDVELVWDPMWTPDFISDRGYAELGRPRPRTMI